MYVPINEATREPKRRLVAAWPVPKPRCGPGKDSGVMAYMMAYMKFASRLLRQLKARSMERVLAAVYPNRKAPVMMADMPIDHLRPSLVLTRRLADIGPTTPTAETIT